jgi:hypothetical protein
MEARMLTEKDPSVMTDEEVLSEKEVQEIRKWIRKGFEIEIFKKPDGTNNIKTVRRKRLIIE